MFALLAIVMAKWCQNKFKSKERKKWNHMPKIAYSILYPLPSLKSTQKNKFMEICISMISFIQQEGKKTNMWHSNLKFHKRNSFCLKFRINILHNSDHNLYRVSKWKGRKKCVCGLRSEQPIIPIFCLSNRFRHLCYEFGLCVHHGKTITILEN